MSDDEEDNECPLCVQELDLSDRNFLPCPCGYRVCMWCWHHIRENLNGLCPACRSPYQADPHAFSAVDRQEIVKTNRERKQKEKKEKKTDKPVSTKPVIATIADRRHLHNYRVIQRNLVYVIGLPGHFANEDLLRKGEYFGQYGKIGKVVIHRNPGATASSTFSAYVTFVYKEDAKASIHSLEGHMLDGHLLRASFGTTKYCNNFIRGVVCNNPDCVYLHEVGEDEDRFTKEEIQVAVHSKMVQIPGNNQMLMTGGGGPSGTGKRPTGEPILPPPVYYADITPVGTANGVGGLRSGSSGNLSNGKGSQGGSTENLTAGTGFKAAVEQGNTLSPMPGTPEQSPLLSALHNHHGNMASDPPPLEPLPGSLDSLNGAENFPSLLSSVSRKDGMKDSSSSSSSQAMTRQEKTAEAFRLRAAGADTAALNGIAGISTTSLGGLSGVKINPAALINAAAMANTQRNRPVTTSPPQDHQPVDSNSGAVSGAATEDGGGEGLGGDSAAGGDMNSTNPTVGETQGLGLGEGGTSGGISTNMDGMTIQPGALRMVRRGQGLGGATGVGVGLGGPTTTVSSNSEGTPTESDSPQTISSATLHPTGGKSEAMKQQATASAFNGLGRCALFPVPVSSLAISVWSGILSSSSADLSINPYGKLLLPISELLDLTLPPVDAICQSPWPKPLAYYRQGVGADGTTHAPAGRHVHRLVGNLTQPPIPNPLMPVANTGISNKNNLIPGSTNNNGTNEGNTNGLTLQQQAQYTQAAYQQQMKLIQEKHDFLVNQHAAAQAQGGNANGMSTTQVQQQLQQLVFQQQQLQLQFQRQLQLQQQQQQGRVFDNASATAGANPNGGNGVVNNNVGGALGNNNSANGINLLQQMFPSVKMSFGAPNTGK